MANLVDKNSTLLIDESAVSGLRDGDELRVEYYTRNIFGNRGEAGDGELLNLTIKVLGQPYYYCDNSVTMQYHSTTELAAGKVEVIPLDGITVSDQC